MLYHNTSQSFPWSTFLPDQINPPADVPTFPTRRRFLSVGLVALAAVPAALLSAGCPAPDKASGGGDTAGGGGGDKAASPSPAASSGGGKPSSSKTIKAGLVTDVGGVGDRSFNALAWEGLQTAQKELGFDIKYTESKQNADYVTNLSRFAQNGYDVVFAIGYAMADALKEVAPRFPNVKFAIIDGEAPKDAPNAVSYQFREEEGSFLAGALAGAMTKKNVIGFVGGADVPLIHKFQAGYAAGAKTTNPKIDVKVTYAGKFDDPQKGQEAALSQLGAGADIIFHAAGATGVGVIKAMQNKGAGFYAIGVDKDQDGDAPGRVLTSMVKRVDVAVLDVCKAVAGGTFSGGTHVLGLKENGVGLSDMKYTKKDVPAPVMVKIEALKADIISGKIKPPASDTELAAFKPGA